jgi:antitoxin HicB
MSKDLSYYMSLKYPVEVRETSEGGYFVTHPDLDGCMAEGSSLDEAVSHLTDARELWIEARLAGGYDVPEPDSEEYSGRVSLRMMPGLHAQLVRIADRRQVSLNLLINSVLSSFAGGAEPLMDVLQELKSAVAEIRASKPHLGAAARSPRSTRRSA